jgi:hypothetical protein
VTRREFSPATKREAYARSRGLCECYRVPPLNRPNGCGVKLISGSIFYEHIVPDNIAQDSSLENCAVLTRTCWREKTDSYDRKIIAKSNHSRDRNRGIARAFRSRPIIGTKRSGWKHYMAGEWVRR